jgi:diadenosine tetraphosphate (Ap4A) HIT family hydrolase
MGILLLLLLAVVCECDLADAAKMTARECGLCREAEKHPTETDVFFLKDINPRKPNRWLALPRRHGPSNHPLSEMTPKERAAFWAAAIGKARELWGDEWGLAINGDGSRTQCHAHLHIGKLLKGVETDNFVAVSSPAQIPVPQDGSGLWVHPVGNKLHVHLNEQITETVLLR